MSDSPASRSAVGHVSPKVRICVQLDFLNKEPSTPAPEAAKSAVSQGPAPATSQAASGSGQKPPLAPGRLYTPLSHLHEGEAAAWKPTGSAEAGYDVPIVSGPPWLLINVLLVMIWPFYNPCWVAVLDLAVDAAVLSPYDRHSTGFDTGFVSQVHVCRPI